MIGLNNWLHSQTSIYRACIYLATLFTESYFLPEIPGYELLIVRYDSIYRVIWCSLES